MKEIFSLLVKSNRFPRPVHPSSCTLMVSTRSNHLKHADEETGVVHSADVELDSLTASRKPRRSNTSGSASTTLSFFAAYRDLLGKYPFLTNSVQSGVISAVSVLASNVVVNTKEWDWLEVRHDAFLRRTAMSGPILSLTAHNLCTNCCPCSSFSHAYLSVFSLLAGSSDGIDDAAVHHSNPVGVLRVPWAPEDEYVGDTSSRSSHLCARIQYMYPSISPVCTSHICDEATRHDNAASDNVPTSVSYCAWDHAESMGLLGPRQIGKGRI